MIEVSLKIFIATFFLILLGKSKDKVEKDNHISNFTYDGIIGIIYLSIIALFLNFFIALNKINNTFLFVVFFLFLIALRRKFLFKSYKKLFLFLFLFTIFASSLILFSDSYRPDAGLYHYPFINILNDNKIIIGLSNLHFRFGHISIIQYVSAIFNNNIFGLQGITMPLAILIALVVCYLSAEIIEYSKDPKYKFYNIFNSCILVYFAFKINRYSEYGNDAPGHALAFLLISLFIKNCSVKKFQNNDLLLIATYIFTVKSTLIFYLIIPIFIFIKSHLKYFNKFKNLITIFFLIIWILKNILISSCILYPMDFSCMKSTSWYNSKFENSVKEIQIRSEAWNKDWPNREDKNIKQVNYVKNFNWILAWSKNHFLKVLKILSLYIFLLYLLYLLYRYQNNKSHEDITIIKEIYKFKYYYLIIIVCFLGIMSWFLKAPIYRYGYSYIIILISLLFSLILVNANLKINNKSFYNSSVFIVILVFIVFFLKQSIRIGNNWSQIYTFKPWPKFYGMDKLNTPPLLKEIYIDNFKIYKSKKECMYSKSPCTNIELDKNLRVKKDKGYYVIYYENL